jgi:hypothetical protein
VGDVVVAQADTDTVAAMARDSNSLRMTGLRADECGRMFYPIHP